MYKVHMTGKTRTIDIKKFRARQAQNNEYILKTLGQKFLLSVLQTVPIWRGMAQNMLTKTATTVGLSYAFPSGETASKGKAMAPQPILEITPEKGILIIPMPEAHFFLNENYPERRLTSEFISSLGRDPNLAVKGGLKNPTPWHSFLDSSDYTREYARIALRGKFLAKRF